MSLCLLALAVSPIYAASNKVEVVIFNDNQELYQNFFDAFEAKTGIKVEPQWYIGNQNYKWETTMTRISGGVSPDVVTATSTELVKYAADGLLALLDEFVARDRMSLDGVVPLLVDVMKWDGKLWQLPYGASSQAMAYNANMFAKAGVTPPPLEWNDPNWTWETFLSNAQKLTIKNSDGTVAQWGSVNFGWLSWPQHWGVDYVDASLQKFTGLDPKVLESWQKLQDMAWRYEVAPKPGMRGADLFSGTAAMSHRESYTLQTVLDNENPLVFNPWFKVGENKAYGIVFPMGMSVLESAPNKDNAWEFVKFATLDPEGNYLWNLAAGALPGMFKAHSRWLASMEPYKATNIATIVDLTSQYGAIQRLLSLTELTDAFGLMSSAYDAVMNNEQSPRQAMDGIAQAMQDTIDRGKQ